MKRAICSILVLVTASGCNGNAKKAKWSPPAGANSPEHVAAKKRFLELAAGGLSKANYGEVDSVVKACFLKGDLASNYTELLKTANDHNGNHYLWKMGEVGDGKTSADAITFDVFLWGEPQVIHSAEIVWWDN